MNSSGGGPSSSCCSSSSSSAGQSNGAGMSSDASAAAATAATAAALNLRRRSSQMIDSPPLMPQHTIGGGSNSSSSSGGGGGGGVEMLGGGSGSGVGGIAHAGTSATSASPGSSIANRRPAIRSAMMQTDFSLSLTALTPAVPPSPPLLPSVIRSTTPTPAANSPLSTPFGRKRAADEIKAVNDMLNGTMAETTSVGIQRPASAPPRGRRPTLKLGAEIDDAGADAIEKASVASAKANSTTIAEIASETIEQFAAHLSDRALAMLLLFIVAWGAVLSLDRLTTYSYQTIVTNSFAHHSSLAEVNVIRAVIAAIAAVPFATVADLGGRAQAFTAGLVLYAAGHAAMAGSTSVQSYIGGVVLYELGANGLVCLQNTVLADMTSSRNRLFFQILPQMPFLVFSFISSDIYSAILPRWRWGIGLFAILAPATLLPVISILSRSQKSAVVTSSQSARRASLHQIDSPISYAFAMIKHLWQVADLFGLALLAASLTLALIPLTWAASAPNQWEDPKILGMISAGAALFVFFGYWELRQASNPIIPKVLLRNRTFWGGALSFCFLSTAHGLMLAYFPTYLYVVHGASNRAQQNFSVIYSFTIGAASLPIALVVRHAKTFKVFIVIGIFIFTGGFGVMIGNQDSNFEIAIAQVVIGLGGAMTVALIQASVQVAVAPVFVAPSIAALNVFPCVGFAFGSAIAGAMWSSLLPGKLARALSPTGHLNDLATIYAEPLTWIEQNPIGTSTRTAVVSAYVSCWRMMMVVTTLICASSFAFILLTDNVRLNDSLSADSVVTPTADDQHTFRGGVCSSQSGRLFGDQFFERFEGAFGRKLVRRNPKQPTPDSPTDTRVNDVAERSGWSSWTPFRKKQNGTMPITLAVRNKNDETQSVEKPLASPVEASPGPAPILVVDEAPFVPRSCPPTPPATRSSASLRPFSPL